MSQRRYTSVHVRVCPGQDKRLQKALRAKKSAKIHFITVNQSAQNTQRLTLTQAQVRKVQKAPVGTKFSFSFSKAQIQANLRHEGGFLPLLAAALVPLISGIVGGVAERAIAGSGLKGSNYHRDIVLRKRSHVMKVSPRGQGLFLTPYSSYASYFPKGRGLFLSPPSHGRGFKKISLKELPHTHPLRAVPFLPDLL